MLLHSTQETTYIPANHHILPFYIQTGEEVLRLYSWDGSTIGMCLLYLACIMAAFLLLGYLALRRSLPRYMTVAEPNKTKAATAAQAPATAIVAVVS